MPTLDVDVATMLDALARHEVSYVVIGGFAVELHDVAVPPTRDVDITPARRSANLERLAAALRDLDARFRVPGGPAVGVEIPGGITSDWLAGVTTLALVTSAGPLDVRFTTDGTDGYEDLARHMSEIDYGGHAVPVASLEDVVRSKEAAGRGKDLLVLPALHAHLRRGSR